MPGRGWRARGGPRGGSRGCWSWAAGVPASASSAMGTSLAMFMVVLPVEARLLEVHQHEDKALALGEPGHGLADHGAGGAGGIVGLHSVPRCRRGRHPVAGPARAE